MVQDNEEFWLGMESVGATSTSEVINSELVTMENFGFVQPFFKSVGAGLS